MSAPAGWYGKLPALGDFASRRLAPGFIEPWDGWLAAGLAAWREADPAGWLPAYLAGPSWRFLLEDGALAAGSPPLCGVLMPSVDRVGRYFPLTLAATLAPGGRVGVPLLDWLARLDVLAWTALHDDWQPERLEAELAQLGGVPEAESAEPLPPWAEPLLRACREPARRSWWWCGNADGTTRLVEHSGLPPHTALAGLLAGGPMT